MREAVWTLNSLDARPRHGRCRRYWLGSPHFWQHRTDGSSTRCALPSRPPDGQDGRKDPDGLPYQRTSLERSVPFFFHCAVITSVQALRRHQDRCERERSRRRPRRHSRSTLGGKGPGRQSTPASGSVAHGRGGWSMPAWMDAAYHAIFLCAARPVQGGSLHLAGPGCSTVRYTLVPPHCTVVCALPGCWSLDGT